MDPLEKVAEALKIAPPSMRSVIQSELESRREDRDREFDIKERELDIKDLESIRRDEELKGIWVGMFLNALFLVGLFWLAYKSQDKANASAVIAALLGGGAVKSIDAIAGAFKRKKDE